MVVVKFHGWLQKWLTILYIKAGFIDLVDISPYSFQGFTRTVYWYSSDSDRGGHCTPFNTIMINQRKLENYSDMIHDYVFLHEFGHTRVPSPIRLIFYLVMVPSLFIVLAATAAFFIQPFAVLVGTGSLYKAGIQATALLVIELIFLPVVMIGSWSDECYAELFALKHLGEEKFLECHEELQRKSERKFLRRIWHRILYPPTGLVLWVSKKIIE